MGDTSIALTYSAKKRFVAKPRAEAKRQPQTDLEDSLERLTLRPTYAQVLNNVRTPRPYLKELYHLDPPKDLPGVQRVLAWLDDLPLTFNDIKEEDPGH
jgi:hypothetical protein